MFDSSSVSCRLFICFSFRLFICVPLPLICPSIYLSYIPHLLCICLSCFFICPFSPLHLSFLIAFRLSVPCLHLSLFASLSFFSPIHLSLCLFIAVFAYSSVPPFYHFVSLCSLPLPSLSACESLFYLFLCMYPSSVLLWPLYLRFCSLLPSGCLPPVHFYLFLYGYLLVMHFNPHILSISFLCVRILSPLFLSRPRFLSLLSLPFTLSPPPSPYAWYFLLCTDKKRKKIPHM